MSKENNIKQLQKEILSDYIQIEISIQCDKCSKGSYANQEEPEEELYEDGWRVSRGICYCPECAKIYLKSKR